MKTIYLFIISVLLLACSNKLDSQDKEEEETPIFSVAAKCINGVAGGYPCNGYDLLAHVPLNIIAGANTEGNDSWGWVDPDTNKEYALMGTNKGVSFIDITNPADFEIIGFLPTATDNSLWRDVKVYNNYAYIVSEANSHGLQIFNLKRLRTATNTPVTFTADALSNLFGSAHNIVINETVGYAYPVGTTRSGTYKGGPLFINIQDAQNPVLEGGFTGYSHDAQVVTYNGPDTDYSGKEILISSNETEVIIVDVSSKTDPKLIATIDYPNIGYTHQGWFTEDF
jgi:Uncharacterized conserved protein